MEKDKQHKPVVQLPTDQRISKKEEIKVNPNPRANENIPDADKKKAQDNDTGTGSEITDGEDG